jgi:hypothetical protein
MKLTLRSDAFAAVAALLLVCSSIIQPGASFQLRQCSRTLAPCSSQFRLSRVLDRTPMMFFQSGGLGSKGLESFHRAQWDLYVKNHVGHWVGIQTGYDPEVVDVADYMYTEVDLGPRLSIRIQW